MGFHCLPGETCTGIGCLTNIRERHIDEGYIRKVSACVGEAWGRLGEGLSEGGF
jgi:hypothetical protein